MTPPPACPSGSIMSIAKLLVPAGGLTQDNCGETFSPRQLGLCGSLAWLLPTLAGIIPPSLNVADDMLKSFSCALALAPAQASATTAAIRHPGFMTCLRSVDGLPCQARQ